MKFKTKKRICKNVVFIMFSCMIFLLIPYFISANSGELYIGFNREGDIYKIIPFKEKNQFYHETLYYGINPMDMEFVSKDIALYSDSIFITPSKDVPTQQRYSDLDFNQTYTLKFHEKTYSINFCNQNGRCEPCREGICEVIENYFTCPDDCSSGGNDSYCDLQPDQICDKDCEYMDFDCEACMDYECVYDGMHQKEVLCNDLGGAYCPLTKVCQGKTTVASDTGSLCCIGECKEKKAPEDKRPSEYKEENNEEDLVSDIGLGDEYELKNSDETPENADVFDMQLFIYIFILVILLCVAVILVTYFEIKAVHKEHQVRNYVYQLFNLGYNYDQVIFILQQQKIEQHLINKVMKAYKR